MEVECKADTLEEMLEKIELNIQDKEHAEWIRKFLLVCRNESERQLIGFRYGVEDGVTKTIQETAEKFGISRERVSMVESRVFRRTVGEPPRRRMKLTDYLDD